jgi:nucleoside-diphosphate-sugar epimerase
LRTLVTGAAGFIGSHLCDRLIAEGHDVVGFDDLSAGSLTNLAAASPIHLVEGDLGDADAVLQAARGCDLIFHQGAVRSVPRSIEDPVRTTEVNVGGTLNVLLAAREEGSRVVFASSSSVYGNRPELPLHEGMEPQPRSPYAASKLAGEFYCSTWSRTFGVPTVSLRYFNVYGPRQDPHSQYATVIPAFILACLEGNRPTIHGDGEQARDFTYVDDVVEANLMATNFPRVAIGRAINIGGGARPTSINALLRLIAGISGTDVHPRHVEPRPGDVRVTDADISLATAVLGFRPTISMQRGLERTLEWFRMTLPSQLATAGGRSPGLH